jgi:hypothetical protein
LCSYSRSYSKEALVKKTAFRKAAKKLASKRKKMPEFTGLNKQYLRHKAQESIAFALRGLDEEDLDLEQAEEHVSAVLSRQGVTGKLQRQILGERIKKIRSGERDPD